MLSSRRRKPGEAKEVKAGKEEKDEPVLAAESEKNKWVFKTGERQKSHDTDRCAGGGNRNSGFGGVSGRRQNYEGFGGYV